MIPTQFLTTPTLVGATRAIFPFALPFCVSFCLPFCLLFSLSAYAQPPGVSPGMPPGAGGPPPKAMEAIGKLGAIADPEPIPGIGIDTILSDGASRTTLDLGLEYKFKRGWQEVFKPSLGLRQEFYDLDDFDADQATLAELGFGYLRFTPTGWSAFTKLEVGGAAEDTDDLFDDPTFLAILGLGRKFRNGNQAGLGLIVKQDIEEDWRAFPIPQLDIGFADHWRFTTERGILITRESDTPWTWAFGVDYVNTRFRTKRGEVLEYNAAPAFLQATYAPHPGFEFQSRIGATTWGEIELDDERGRGIRDEDVDPGFYGALKAKWVF